MLVQIHKFVYRNKEESKYGLENVFSARHGDVSLGKSTCIEKYGEPKFYTQNPQWKERSISRKLSSSLRMLPYFTTPSNENTDVSYIDFNPGEEKSFSSTLYFSY